MNRFFYTGECTRHISFPLSGIGGRRNRLAHLTGARWAIETCFREGKQLLGLGDYEGCSWQGWHRHMTLCLLLHFFLLQGQRALKKSNPA